jgi:hypothetical protein
MEFKFWARSVKRCWLLANARKWQTTSTIAVMAVWRKEMALQFENEYNMQEYGIQVLGWKREETLALGKLTIMADDIYDSAALQPSKNHFLKLSDCFLEMTAF